VSKSIRTPWCVSVVETSIAPDVLPPPKHCMCDDVFDGSVFIGASDGNAFSGRPSASTNVSWDDLPLHPPGLDVRARAIAVRVFRRGGEFPNTPGRSNKTAAGGRQSPIFVTGSQ
jgi:hypothetical protein